ncbi:MAG: two-component system, chemotaxis family, sensor kinase CheA [Thermotogaceae bacterium]|nr:two-component system, chemotaxis family, sensor kinase CheA [Thermotogaceae bacterium]
MENDSFIPIFLEDLKEKLEEAEEALKKFFDEKSISYLKDVYRAFHTIKGSASLVGFKGFQKVSHKIEDVFKNIYEGKRKISQQDTARIMKIIEFFKSKNSDLTDEESEKLSMFLNGEIDDLDFEENVKKSDFSESECHKVLESVIKVENNLILGNLNLAMIELTNLKNYLSNLIYESEFISIEKVMDGFENLVFQESTLNGKKVKLKLLIENQDLKIPLKDSQMLRDSLIHIVKNSISHGIEKPEERKKKGKPEEGAIKISAHLESKNIVLIIEDDGSGLAIEKIKQKARSLGYENVDPLGAIFMAGFSTKKEADFSAGRGIGLYAAKTFVEERGGTIEVQTQKDKGTKFIIKLPTTHFIKKVMIVKSNGNIFAIDISEIILVKNNLEIFEFEGQKSLKYRDELYSLMPFSSLQGTFGIFLKDNKAFLVDEITGIFNGQLVQKDSNISKYFVKNIFPFPVPLIDTKLISSHKFSKSEKISNKKTILIVDDSSITRLVLQNFLESYDYDVLQAKNGIEALEKSGFDAAVVDVEMPEIDGFETTRRLKEKFPDVPVIILTTRSKPEDIKKGLESGANAYMIKGENLERLIKLLEKFLKR